MRFRSAPWEDTARSQARPLLLPNGNRKAIFYVLINYLTFKEKKKKPIVVACICNPSTVRWQAGAGESPGSAWAS